MVVGWCRISRRPKQELEKEWERFSLAVLARAAPYVIRNKDVEMKSNGFKLEHILVSRKADDSMTTCRRINGVIAQKCICGG